jgi:pimeloyl-ACP methyl ester carboxylesterase
LVLFAPGFQISSAAYRDWIEHLASWGIAAVRADPPGGLFDVSHVAMTLDLRAVLDDLLAPAALAIAPDPQRIILSGHSLGGKLAVMVADSDERVAAVFTLDPVNGGGPSGYSPERPNIVPSALENLSIPLGFVGELLDGTGGLFGACAPLAQNYQTFFEAAAASPSAYEWTLDGASHTDFVTNIEACGLACTFCRTGTLDRSITHAFMRAAGVAFIRAHLDDDTDACAWLTGTRVPAAVTIRQSP